MTEKLQNGLKFLELLAQYEVEVATTAHLLSRSFIHLVEAVGPVDTHQTNHGEEDANTKACRALHLEGVELLDLVPRVTCLDKA